jgi:ABC-type multidrug transport system permease subunit
MLWIWAWQILCSVILGTLFMHVKHDRLGVTQRQGFINFTLAFIVFTTIDAMPVFLKERQVFIRETSRGAFRTSSYVLAKPIVSLPFLVLLALIYTCTSYFLVGLVKDGTVVLIYMLMIFLTFCVADAFVAFITSLVPDMSAGQPIVSSMCAFFYLFSGLYILR